MEPHGRRENYWPHPAQQKLELRKRKLPALFCTHYCYRYCSSSPPLRKCAKRKSGITQIGEGRKKYLPHPPPPPQSPRFVFRTRLLLLLLRRKVNWLLSSPLSHQAKMWEIFSCEKIVRKSLLRMSNFVPYHITLCLYFCVPSHHAQKKFLQILRHLLYHKGFCGKYEGRSIYSCKCPWHFPSFFCSAAPPGGKREGRVRDTDRYELVRELVLYMISVPSIAQLVERWTVVETRGHHRHP